MFKPNQRKGAPLFPLNESEGEKTEALLKKYLKKWFTLSNKGRSFFGLYFGVMYNSEMYRRLQFLGLAQGLESYHESFKERPTSRKWDNEIKVIKKFYPQIPRGCIDKIKDCHKPSYGARVAEVYGEHSEIADKYFCTTKYFHTTDKKKDKFSKKVSKTRNYYSHSARGKKEKGVVYEEEMLPLIQDLQFLLHLAIMKEVGFTKQEIIQRYTLDK